MNKYETNIYRKKTFTWVYLNCTSLTARRYKIGLINCLAEQAWKICSDENDRAAEFEKIKHILQRNEYPLDVIEKAIKKFFERKRREAQAVTKEPYKPIKRFLKLPYAGKKSEDFAYKLKILVLGHFSQVDFTVVYKALRTIGELFPFKDRVRDNFDRSRIVYSMRCKTCQAEYIGKTERALSTRIEEHKNPNKDKNSACKKHTRDNTGHVWNYEEAEIVDTAENDQKLLIKELLHILSRRPTCNKQLGSQSSYEIKTILIKAYAQYRSDM